MDGNPTVDKDVPPKKKFRSKLIKSVQVPKTIPAKVVTYKDGKAVFRPIENHDGVELAEANLMGPTPQKFPRFQTPEESEEQQPVSSADPSNSTIGECISYYHGLLDTIHG